MNYIVDSIGAVVALMRTDKVLIKALQDGLPALTADAYSALMPFYMYGHKVEIANRLTQQDKDKVYKYQKYPLVILRLDTAENVENGIIDYQLNVAFMMLTNKKWEAPERYTKVFKPILYPMYESFLKQLKNVGGFMWDQGQDRPRHTKIDRPYWGTSTENGNTADIFNDPLDAIELIDLRISQNYKC